MNTDSFSIAVLPFKNMSHEVDKEFFCDGMAEEIIHALSKIDQLKVISRSSSFVFKNQNISPKTIAEQLNVRLLLSGSVRIAENMMRVSVELVDIESEATLWTQSWDRPKQEVFSIQDEVSLRLADKIREQLGHLEIAEHLVETNRTNPVAYELYLKGRFHFIKWNPEDCQKAIDFFEEAIRLDPEMIDALVGLADAYSFLAVAGFAPREESWLKAREAISKAQKLDDKHAGLNNILANDAFFTEANFQKAFDYILKAIQHQPNHTDSHRFLTFLYTLNGNFNKAKSHISFAKSLDPLNPETHFFEANYYYRIGEYQKAEIILKDLLNQNNKNLPALIISINILLIKNETNAIKELLNQTAEELFAPDELLGIKSLIDLAEGNKDSDSFINLKKQAEANDAQHAHAYLYTSYVRSNQYNLAFDCLNKLFDINSSILLIHFSDPLNDSIQKTQQFKTLHSKIFSLHPIKKKAKQKPNSLDHAINQKIINGLEELMQTEKVFLNPELSLRLLASFLNVHPNLLSRVINSSIGKNYNDYINALRISYFKKLVLDPANQNISLLGLAYESGFNSKTVFNTAFKKQTGMTPKEFQNSQQ